MLLRVALMALAASFLAVPVARAQSGPVKVGVCNVQKVWEAMEERKALNEQNNVEQEKLKQELARRQQEVKEIQDQRAQLKPGSQVYEEKTKLLMEKAIELDVWARMKDAELNRKRKDQTQAL
jgi:Skp family chaperone for outer membrane proteins